MGCHEQDVAFHWREGFLDSVMLDSGWVPAGSPLQVRVALFAGGETEIDLAGTSFTWWPAPLSERVPGIPGTGFFSVDYGIEFVARARFDVEVAGVSYRWEGDIPTGSIPRDLRLAAMAAFDSMLLPPQTPRPVMLADTTERIEVFGLNLGGLPSGVSGGFALEVEGALDATYRTERIEIGDATTPITAEGASTVAGPDAGETDYGASKDIVIQPIGQIDYDGAINLYPVFYIEVLGRRFDLGIPAIPVPIVDLGREVRFDPATVHVPLPDANITPLAIDFGAVEVGARAAETVELRNDGEAPLRVVPRTPRLPFSVLIDEVTIPPGASRTMEVRFQPDRAELVEAMLFLETNDPDEPLVVIRLTGEGIGGAVADGGIGADAGPAAPGGITGGGCACGVGAGSSPTSPWSSAPSALLVGLAIAIAVRRRR